MPKLDATSIRVHRTGAGPTLFLLHGIGGTRRSWDGLAPLADRYDLVSYDLPGHGETPEPGEPFEIDDLSEQLAAVLTTCNVGRAHVIGCSLGGMVAQQFAAAWPMRVDRLVLCDTTPALSEGTRDDVLRMGGPAAAAMARADLMDLAEEIMAPTLVLCAEGADVAMREGADFLARSIPLGGFAFVPGAVRDSVAERPDWLLPVLRDFLG